jgi:MFS family permease
MSSITPALHGPAGDLWNASPERKEATGRAKARIPVGLGTVFGGLFLVLMGEDTQSAWVWSVAGIIVVLLGASIIGLAVAERLTAYRAYSARQERAAREQIDLALDALGDEFDLRGLLRLNRKQMEAYEALTRRQAASSYQLSHVALALAMAALLGGSIAVLLVDTTATKVVAAALATVGSTLSGFIARTYLRIYERTLLQLNHYFEQPLVSSYVLTAERLIGCMSGERRDDAYAKVVDELMDWRTPAPVKTGRRAPARKPAPPATAG